MDLQKLFYYDLFEKNYDLKSLKESMKINIPKIYNDTLLDLSKLQSSDIDNIIEQTLEETNCLTFDKTTVNFTLTKWQMSLKFIIYTKYSELLNTKINIEKIKSIIQVPVHSGTDMSLEWESGILKLLKEGHMNNIKTVLYKTDDYIGGRWLFSRLEQFTEKYPIYKSLLSPIDDTCPDTGVDTGHDTGVDTSHDTATHANKRGMNKDNRKALEVWSNEGSAAFIKHCFTGEKGQQLSYSDMRSRYG